MNLIDKQRTHLREIEKEIIELKSGEIDQGALERLHGL
jgi:hypothetical protein